MFKHEFYLYKMFAICVFFYKFDGKSTINMIVLNEGVNHNPRIVFNDEVNTLFIEKKSFPENAEQVFAPVINWLTKFNYKKSDLFKLFVRLDYYNTASSRKLFDIIKSLNNIYKSGFPIEVEWHYMSDDEDMLESGKYFSELVEIPFNFILVD